LYILYIPYVYVRPLVKIVYIYIINSDLIRLFRQMILLLKHFKTQHYTYCNVMYLYVLRMYTCRSIVVRYCSFDGGYPPAA
jgi:hypothetical protein